VNGAKVNDFGQNHISYTIGHEADETRPQQFLSSDRNMQENAGNTPPNGGSLGNSIHVRVGNAVLSDGSSQSLSESTLKKQIYSAWQESGPFEIQYPTN
jgi:hypothetical protein